VRAPEESEVVLWCLERRLSSTTCCEVDAGESRGDGLCEDGFQSMDSFARNSKSRVGED
jgi:hypothetical protein